VTNARRVIALDVGDVRIGVAVTDPARILAQPVEVYRRVGYGPDCRYVQGLCARFDTEDVLLGLPLNMDGSQGPQAQKAQAFGRVLAQAGLNVFYQDERLTTVTAEQTLIAGGVRREDRKRHVDKLAATIILEQWLSSGATPPEKFPTP
jgi:putative Holliday junction resolvase